MTVYRKNFACALLLCLLAAAAFGQGVTLPVVERVVLENGITIILHEKDDVPLIGNCWTSPECRGQGIYPYIISLCSDIMAARGFKRILISCAPDNFASISGIEKAGFKRVRCLNSYLLLTKFMLQKLEAGGRHRYRLGVL